MALGELKWNWKVQGILEKVHSRWNEVTAQERQNSEGRQKHILFILLLTYGDAQWSKMIVNILAFTSQPQMNADLSWYPGASPDIQPPLPCIFYSPKGEEISLVICLNEKHRSSEDLTKICQSQDWRRVKKLNLWTDNGNTQDYLFSMKEQK